MHLLKASFATFQKVTLYQCIGCLGVYFIWDNEAQLIPTYIGAGNILDRVKNHHARFKRPLDGYIAFLGKVGDKEAMHHAEVLEGMLLEVARCTNRLPTENRQLGRTAKTRVLLNEHRLL